MGFLNRLWTHKAMPVATTSKKGAVDAGISGTFAHAVALLARKRGRAISPEDRTTLLMFEIFIIGSFDFFLL